MLFHQLKFSPNSNTDDENQLAKSDHNLKVVLDLGRSDSTGKQWILVYRCERGLTEKNTKKDLMGVFLYELAQIQLTCFDGQLTRVQDASDRTNFCFFFSCCQI